MKLFVVFSCLCQRIVALWITESKKVSLRLQMVAEGWVTAGEIKSSRQQLLFCSVPWFCDAGQPTVVVWRLPQSQSLSTDTAKQRAELSAEKNSPVVKVGNSTCQMDVSSFSTSQKKTAGRKACWHMLSSISLLDDFLARVKRINQRARCTPGGADMFSLSNEKRRAGSRGAATNSKHSKYKNSLEGKDGTLL